MKIGIMGGTFNPIHNAHLMIAEFARDEYALDEVWFMTSGNPPHKQETHIPAADVRHAMTRLAVQTNPHFQPCAYEVEKEDYSYTAHTLEYLRKIYPEHKFYFIIGGDSLHQFHRWYCPHGIAKLCTLLVFSRVGYDVDTAEDIDRVKREFYADVRQIHAPLFGVSSSMIRRRLAEGKSIRYLTPDTVIQYIRENGLYKE